MKMLEITDFKPKYLDLWFKDWENKGLIFIHDLFDGEILKSFNYLQENFGLKSTDFYRLLQLRSYLTSHKVWQPLPKLPFDLEHFFIKTIKKQEGVKVVSQLYKLLQTTVTGSPLGVKEKWKLEMTVVIEDHIWEQVCENGHKLTSRILGKTIPFWQLMLPGP